MRLTFDNKDEAKKKWYSYNKSNCNFKSWIKPTFNFKKFRFEWYFDVEPDYTIKKATMKLLDKLSEISNKFR